MCFVLNFICYSYIHCIVSILLWICEYLFLSVSLCVIFLIVSEYFFFSFFFFCKNQQKNILSSSFFFFTRFDGYLFHFCLLAHLCFTLKKFQNSIVKKKMCKVPRFFQGFHFQCCRRTDV